MVRRVVQKAKDYDAVQVILTGAVITTRRTISRDQVLTTKRWFIKKKAIMSVVIKIYRKAIELSKKNKREYAVNSIQPVAVVVVA